jgi:hypothetical protein
MKINKARAKKIVLGQLANYLSQEVVIDGIFDNDEVEIFDNAQNELIKEFTRRAAGEPYHDL